MRKFFKNKKAESKMLEIILFILIVLVLLAIIWNLVTGLIKKNMEITEVKYSLFGHKIDINNVDSDNLDFPSKVNLSLTRGPGDIIIINRTEIKKFADIVFIIDSTSSMEDEITEVYNISSKFVDLLSSNKINFKIGIVEFKDIYTDSQGTKNDFPSKIYKFSNNMQLTSDINEIKSTLLTINNSIIQGSGGDKSEAHLIALENATKNIVYRNIPGYPYNISKKFLIMLSDAPPHALDCFCNMSQNKSLYYECRGSDNNIYTYDSNNPGETLVAHDKNIGYLVEGKLRYVEWKTLQMTPDIDSNKIVWTDRRDFFGGSSQYHIYMCDLNTKPTTSTITEWCNVDAPETNRLKIISQQPYFNYNPRISNNKIVYERQLYLGNPSNGTGNYDVILYDLDTGIESNITKDSNILSTVTIPGSGQTLGYILTKSVYKYPVISGNKIVWQDFKKSGNWDIYMCDLENKPLTRSITDWCLDEITGGLSNITIDINMQMYPEISNNRIVWLDNRSGNNEIFMCDLNLKPAIETVSSWCNNFLKGLSNLTNERNTQTSPKIDNYKIVWTDYRIGNSKIFMCDLENKLPATSVTEWCSGAGLSMITNDAFSKYGSDVNGNKITWSDARNKIWDIYMCDLDNKPGGVSITDYCSGNGLIRLTNSYFYHYNPMVSNDKIVWYGNTNEYGIGITYYTHGLPDNISYFYPELVNNNFTFFYINKQTGLCLNDSLVNLTYYTGGKFYDYLNSNEINNIISSLVDEIITIYQREDYDHIKIVFYNATKTHIIKIFDMPLPYETKKYQIPTSGNLYDYITNITKIEVYMAAYTKDKREVIGPMLSQWTRKF